MFPSCDIDPLAVSMTPSVGLGWPEGEPGMMAPARDWLFRACAIDTSATAFGGLGGERDVEGDSTTGESRSGEGEGDGSRPDEVVMTVMPLSVEAARRRPEPRRPE